MKISIILVFLVSICGCAESEKTTNSKISGSIEFNPVPESFDNLILTIALEDTSLADVAAKKLKEETVNDIAEHPVEFQLTYNSADIEMNNTYSVSVKAHNIAAEPQELVFINTFSYPVITNEITENITIVIDEVN